MVDSQYLYGMCDVVVPSIEGESVMDYFMKLGDRCRHLHLVDCDGNSETHVIPGMVSSLFRNFWRKYSISVIMTQLPLSW